MKKFVLSLLLSLCSLNVCDAANDIEALQADITFFADASCRQLKTNVKLKDLERFQSDLLKTVAAEMLDGTYDK